MFGSDENNGWLILLVILFAMGGINYGGGIGGGFGGGSLNTDFAVTERKLDGLANGLCDGFYAQNTNLLNGFSGVNQNISQTGFDVVSAVNGVSNAVQNCCCTTQRSIDGINYNLATQSCDTRNIVQTATRDIIDNQNANTQRIVDILNANEVQSLRDSLQSARFEISQQAQSNAIVNRLSPYPYYYGYGTTIA